MTNCRVCECEMQEFTQPGLLPQHEDRDKVTCENADCPMEGYTLDKAEYPALDLGPYLRPKQVSL